MTTYEIISTVLGVLGLIASFLMYYITYKTLVEVKNQNQNVKDSILSDTIDKINNAHRNIFMSILSDDDNTRMFNELSDTDDLNETKQNLICTLFFNHAQTIYSYYVKGFLTEDDWVGYQNDIKSFFDGLSFSKKRWNDVRQCYPMEFQTAIDNLITNGRFFYKENK